MVVDQIAAENVKVIVTPIAQADATEPAAVHVKVIAALAVKATAMVIVWELVKQHAKEVVKTHAVEVALILVLVAPRCEQM